MVFFVTSCHVVVFLCHADCLLTAMVALALLTLCLGRLAMSGLPWTND